MREGFVILSSGKLFGVLLRWAMLMACLAFPACISREANYVDFIRQKFGVDLPCVTLKEGNRELDSQIDKIMVCVKFDSAKTNGWPTTEMVQHILRERRLNVGIAADAQCKFETIERYMAKLPLIDVDKVYFVSKVFVPAMGQTEVVNDTAVALFPVRLTCENLTNATSVIVETSKCVIGGEVVTNVIRAMESLRGGGIVLVVKPDVRMSTVAEILAYSYSFSVDAWLYVGPRGFVIFDPARAKAIGVVP